MVRLAGDMAAQSFLFWPKHPHVVWVSCLTNYVHAEVRRKACRDFLARFYLRTQAWRPLVLHHLFLAIGL
jgi:hypothetical protein